jgi:GNAT superfamily N-acetyltransferase
MAKNSAIAVGLLDAEASRDAALIERLTRLINGVYATAESGLWRDGATRTTEPELTGLIEVGQIVVATTQDGHVVGSVHVHQISNDTGEVGTLVAAPEHRGTGVGRALLDFAEDYSRDQGLRAIQLELLVPRAWRHPSKEFLKSWYGRRGYRLIQTRRMDDSHPHLAPLLATPCDLEVREKSLESTVVDSSEPELRQRAFGTEHPCVARQIEAADHAGADGQAADVATPPFDRSPRDGATRSRYGALTIVMLK